MTPHLAIFDKDSALADSLRNVVDLPIRFYDSFYTFELELSQQPPPRCLIVVIDSHNEELALEFIPKLKLLCYQTPLIAVLHNPSPSLMSKVFDAGANDFVRRGYEHDELRIRIHARLQDMYEKNRNDEFRFFDIKLDLRRSLISCRSKTIHLSSMELSLIHLLVRSAGEVVSREKIMSEVWGKFKVTNNNIDRKIFQVRAALLHIGSKISIQSLYGKGVKLTLPEVSIEESSDLPKTTNLKKLKDSHLESTVQKNPEHLINHSHHLIRLAQLDNRAKG